MRCSQQCSGKDIRDIMTDGSVQERQTVPVRLAHSNHQRSTNTNRQTFLNLCLSRFALASGYSPCSVPSSFGRQRPNRFSFSSRCPSRLTFFCGRRLSSTVVSSGLLALAESRELNPGFSFLLFSVKSVYDRPNSSLAQPKAAMTSLLDLPDTVLHLLFTHLSSTPHTLCSADAAAVSLAAAHPALFSAYYTSYITRVDLTYNTLPRSLPQTLNALLAHLLSHRPSLSHLALTNFPVLALPPLSLPPPAASCAATITSLAIHGTDFPPSSLSALLAAFPTLSTLSLLRTTLIPPSQNLPSILATSSLQSLALRVHFRTTPSLAPLLALAPTLTALRIDLSHGPRVTLRALANFPFLQTLTIRDWCVFDYTFSPESVSAGHLTDSAACAIFAGLARFATLSVLTLRSCASVGAAAAWALPPSLVDLTLEGNTRLLDNETVAEGCLDRLPRLAVLRIVGACPGLTSLDGVGGVAQRLRSLRIDGPVGAVIGSGGGVELRPATLERMVELRDLELRGWSVRDDVGVAALALPRLARMSLSHAGGITVGLLEEILRRLEDAPNGFGFLKMIVLPAKFCYSPDYLCRAAHKALLKYDQIVRWGDEPKFG